jgi:pimeloyl-ACP methyl ester carboxylesterase
MLNFRQDKTPGAAHIAGLGVTRRQMLATEAGVVEIEDFGRRTPQAIILITHGLGSIESFGEIAGGLQARFPGRRIITYSRPGRGSSPEPEGSSTGNRLGHEACQLLPAIMRSLGVTSADLVAHSDGVAVAMLLASIYPWMVDRIVAISPQVHADQQYVATTRELLCEGGCNGEIERLCAYHADSEGAIRCWATDRQELAASPDQMLAHISALHAPLLLIQGLRDEYGAQQQMAAISARVEGQMQWVILRKDGHHPQHDNTDVVLDLIAGHIEVPVAVGCPRLMPPASA